MEKIGQWLTESGTTQAQLADQVGVSQPTVSDWINGRTKPTVENLRRLALATGLSIDAMLEMDVAA